MRYARVLAANPKIETDEFDGEGRERSIGELLSALLDGGGKNAGYGYVNAPGL
jgi:hypothetical protein